jgi:hypothetical protein
MYYYDMTQVTGSSSVQGSTISPTTQNDEIQLSLETMHLAFEELNESLESLNTRAGVGLTVLVTALTIMSFRIDLEQISPFGDAWLISLAVLIFSFLVTSFGIYCLAIAMLARPAIGAFNPKALQEEEWKKPLYEFRLKQLATLRVAIDFEFFMPTPV